MTPWDVIARFPNDNPHLAGDREDALLYLRDTEGGGFAFGRVFRDGQRIAAIEYADLVPEGEGFRAASLTFYFSDSLLIQALAAGMAGEDVVSREEANELRAALNALEVMDEYAAVKSSRNGLELDEFCEADLFFSGLDFLNMKPEDVRRIQQLKSERQRFEATANGIILGSLGKRGLMFQLVQTDGVALDEVHFDTCVKLMNHRISEYLIRYAFISGEEAACLPLVKNTVRGLVEELIFLPPSEARMVSIVTNHKDAFEALCACKGRLSYNGALSAILFDLDSARLVQETCLCHYISDDPPGEINLI